MRHSRPAEKSVTPAYRLDRFEPAHAERVASWAAEPTDAYWVAPQTVPPLSAAKVLQWAGPGRLCFQLAPTTGEEPVAYGELNTLSADRAEYWLGHLLVDPQQRGRGVGTRLVEALLRYGAGRLAARRITLVVFPENARAITCYTAAGMRFDGRETHRFCAYDACVSMVRMAWSHP